jgi:nucleoside-diphosphate-sugar epimerase
MRYLIIGGSGFVGTKLIDELKEDNCLNLDKENSKYYSSLTTIGNILNKEEIKISEKITHVVLLAAEHQDNVSPTSLYYDVNVDGTKNVLQKMDQIGIKHLIFTSSVAVYGLNKKNPDENHRTAPFNHYGKSKWEAEKVIKEWYLKDPHEKSVTIIRPTVIFGERNRGNVYNLLKQISSGRFMMIGKGKNKKSMAYVGNVVAFIKFCIQKKDSGYNIYNYADIPDYTMLELSSIIESKMNLSVPKIRIPYWLGMLGGYGFDLLSLLIRKKLPISSVRVKKFCATTQFNSNKAHHSFKAPYTLKQGLENTLEYEFFIN